MQEWLKCFFNEKEATLVIDGKTYHSGDWEKIAGGSEKRVFKIKQESLCFLIPNKYRSEEDWNRKIKAEKDYLDRMTQLGLKTQHFELVPITISVPGKNSYTINALLTKDFASLCKDESLVIYDPKGDKKVSGTAPDFMAMRGRFKEKKFVQEMFRKLINEYATAYTFSLPVSMIQSLDDSQHLCFELSDNPEKPPLARYMFWDVVSDVQQFSFMPLVPTLSEFKKGPEAYTWRAQNGSLVLIAEMVACAIELMLDKPVIVDGDYYKFSKELGADILAAIDDEAYLLSALEFARIQARETLDRIFRKLEEEKKPNIQFVLYLVMAVSTGDLVLVKRGIALLPKQPLPDDIFDDVIKFSTKYNYPDITQLIQSTFEGEKKVVVNSRQDTGKKREHHSEIQHLKSKFLRYYNEQLERDRKSWCGFYSFFARSKVDQNADLSELVNHARGLTNKGTGQRSQKIMKQLGWLDENNQVTSAISPFIGNN